MKKTVAAAVIVSWALGLGALIWVATIYWKWAWLLGVGLVLLAIPGIRPLLLVIWWGFPTARPSRWDADDTEGGQNR